MALGLLVWLAHRVGAKAILDVLETAELNLVFVATALLAIDALAKACNWQQLLQRSVDDRAVPISRVLVWFFAGGFIGAVVPSSASTDACRVVLAARGLPGHAAACAASVITLNALGWLAGCIVGLVGLAGLAATHALPTLLMPVALVFIATMLALPIAYGTLACKRVGVMRLIHRASARWRRVRRGIIRFMDALLVFEDAHARLPVFLLVAALGLLAQTGMFAATAAAIDVTVPFAVWMMLVPLTRIVALVPVSIADFGLIQAVHVWVLGQFAVPPWAAFALSTLFALEGLLIHSTLGALSFLFGMRETDARRVEGLETETR